MRHPPGIRLYHDSKLEAQGFRVSFQTSVYLLPAMVWIGIMAGIVVPIIIAILWKKKKQLNSTSLLFFGGAQTYMLIDLLETIITYLSPIL